MHRSGQIVGSEESSVQGGSAKSCKQYFLRKSISTERVSGLVSLVACTCSSLPKQVYVIQPKAARAQWDLPAVVLKSFGRGERASPFWHVIAQNLEILHLLSGSTETEEQFELPKYKDVRGQARQESEGCGEIRSKMLGWSEAGNGGVTGTEQGATNCSTQQRDTGKMYE